MFPIAFACLYYSSAIMFHRLVNFVTHLLFPIPAYGPPYPTRPICPPAIPFSSADRSIRRHKSFHFDRQWLTLPALFYRHSPNPTEPHALQIDPLVTLRPVLFLGCAVVLEMPQDRWQFVKEINEQTHATGFIVGIEHANRHYVTFVMVAYFEGALQLLHLVASRHRINSYQLPSLVDVRRHHLRWSFLRPQAIRACVEMLERELGKVFLPEFDRKLFSQIEGLYHRHLPPRTIDSLFPTAFEEVRSLFFLKYFLTAHDDRSILF